MSRPRSPLCAWCGAATDLTQSPVMAIYADSEASRQRLVVETCAAPACRALMLQLQNRLRARICEGPLEDMAGFLLAVQQRLLGRSAQA